MFKAGRSAVVDDPWLTYQTASGKVIFGGRPLRPAPVPSTFS
jgi:hypothetical protein